MAAGGTGGEGLFAALRNLLATVIAIGRTRFELLKTEVEEEKYRLLSMLAMGTGALFLFGLGIVLLIVWLATVFWEHRVIVLGISAALTLGGGFLLLSRLKATLSKPSALFQASLAELDKDLARLRSKSGGRS